MFFNAQSLTENEILEADICIVGAGAAGITLAMEFADSPVKVILLESGVEKFRHRTQHLYQGENTGRSYLQMEFTRRRQFGGSTKTWFGRCRPLDEIDFKERAWLPYSGWPLSKTMLDPYFARAQEYCELDEYQYSPNYWLSKENPEIKIDDSSLETKIFQFSPPTDFGENHRIALEKSENIHVFLNANAVNIELDKSGKSVSALWCMTLQKKQFRVKARTYVLAAGGIEVTRLMLASRDNHPHGIGNQHDLVGRFFMEHPHLSSIIVDKIPDGFSPYYLKLNYETTQKTIGLVYAIGLPEKTIEKEHLLNASAFFVQRPVHKTEDVYFSQGAASFLKIADMAQHINAPSFKVFKYAYEASKHAPTVTKLVGKVVAGKFNKNSKFALRLQLETVPNPENRITLSDKKDILGVPRPSLNWQLSKQDLDSYHRFENIVLEQLLVLGFKAKKINHDLADDGWPVSMLPGKHHMGTTRMSNDSRQGVVDENCCVHGLSNLYVSSSSVFPTSGMANPTLTIVALAIRLADHIRKVLRD